MDWIWQGLTTKSLRKKTKQTLHFYCMVTAQPGEKNAPAKANSAMPAGIMPVWFVYSEF